MNSAWGLSVMSGDSTIEVDILILIFGNSFNGLITVVATVELILLKIRLTTTISLKRHATNEQTPISEPGSPVYEDLPGTQQDIATASDTVKVPETGVVPFPFLVPPSADSLMEGADEPVVTAELDRLLGDFLDALSATGEALSQASPQSQT